MTNITREVEFNVAELLESVDTDLLLDACAVRGDTAGTVQQIDQLDRAIEARDELTANQLLDALISRHSAVPYLNRIAIAQPGWRVAS